MLSSCLWKWSLRSLLAGTSALAAIVASGPAGANSISEPPQTAWIAPTIAHLQRMPHDRESEQTKQDTPPIIRGYSEFADPLGSVGTFMPGGSVITSTSAFFADLGSNGRTCFSCHEPQSGWGISARRIEDEFESTLGRAPIFRPVDGAVCPTADVSSLAARRKAYQLLLDRGLIRIAIATPTDPEFSISIVSDPFGCNANPTTGSPPGSSRLTGARCHPPILRSLIRSCGTGGSRASRVRRPTQPKATPRPQPRRRPNRSRKSWRSRPAFSPRKATSKVWGDSDESGATGGAEFLPATVAAFFPGINDPLGGNPKGTPFTSVIFTLYGPWAPLARSPENEARAQIARGEAVFNTKPIKITGVAGLNDVVGQPTISGFCGTCHDSPNVGNHSLKLPINIGISGSGPLDPAKGTGAAPILDIDGLPVFAVTCNSGPLNGTKFTVTDLGRAIISGKCADVGKFKGPILRSLAARAPYFHNGSARTLADVVTFYDERFNIGFTEQEKKDLIAFLTSL